MLDKARSRRQALVTVRLLEYILFLAVFLLVLQRTLGEERALPRMISVVIFVEEADGSLLPIRVESITRGIRLHVVRYSILLFDGAVSSVYIVDLVENRRIVARSVVSR